MHTYAYVEPTQHTKDLGALAQLPLSISSEFDRFRIRLFASLKEVFRQHLASGYAVPLRRRTRCTTSPNLVVRPSLRTSPRCSRLDPPAALARPVARHATQ